MDYNYHVSLRRLIGAGLDHCKPLSKDVLILTLLSLSDTSTNEQKKDWFLRLNPNGGHLQSPPVREANCA